MKAHKKVDLGKHLYNAVHYGIVNQLDIQLGNQLYIQLDNQLDNQLRDKLHDQLNNQKDLSRQSV